MPKLDQNALDTIDELFDHALELHQDGENIAADLMLFSATTLARLNTTREQEAIAFAANTDELDWR